jgi:peroxiredoxin
LSVYVLSVAVVALTAFVVLNLALTAAVIRRLRVLNERLSPPDPGGLPIGTEVPGFEVTAADGGSLTPAVFTGHETLIAFYSNSCSGCKKEAPEFAATAARFATRDVQVLSVLTSSDLDEEDLDQRALRDLLAESSRLVVDDEGAIARAFAVIATPSYFTVGADGRVSGKGLSLADSLAGIRK